MNISDKLDAVNDGYVLVPIEPEGQQIRRLRDILEDHGWRLRLSDVHQLYSGMIQVAQETD